MDHYKSERLFYLALDPVHVGAGGYRLGRVDNTIVREPGTNLPKIPGTSLSGAARSYASMMYGKPEAAGQHKGFKGDLKTCPIIYTFGTAKGDTGQAGTVTFTDARIVLFPVSSSAGPMWVTTAELLEESGFTDVTPPANRESIKCSLPQKDGALNLGWLLFESVTWGATLTAPANLQAFVASLKNRIVIVDHSLFPHIVNSNLEVRTSVAIDSKTGAAETGALFSYEAIPKGTVLFHDIIEDNYRSLYNEQFETVEKQFKPNPNFDKEAKEGDENPSGWERQGGDLTTPHWTHPRSVARAGLGLIEMLGVGGMGTRGFGRLKIVST